jgi:5-deoxy-glucuronate isomerase
MERTVNGSRGGVERIRIDPTEAQWDYLGFSLMTLDVDASFDVRMPDRELAVITVSGAGVAQVGDESFELSRRGVFEEAASVLYAPPGTPISLVATSNWTLAIGSAPATGRYPTRLVTPAEIEAEIRGGGAARRQVNHVLAHPLPAERLIVYEVFVPGGAWAGWPPHCHDGTHDSPYLEETYYFQFDRSDGFGFHRNYADDASYDEVFAVGNGECVTVPRGFHVTAAAPGHNMWILNFLAGELVGEDRARPPYFDPASTWITDDWASGQMDLPAPPTKEWS